MGRGGGSSSRGRGKFKVTRGGGRHFSRDLEPRFNDVQASESSAEELSEDSQDEEDQTAKLAPEMAALNIKLGNTVAVNEDGEEGEGLTKAEKRAKKKPQKKVTIVEPEESEDESEQNNARQAASTKLKEQNSRKEREVAEKKIPAAHAQHIQSQPQGKPLEAKSDLARLQEVRARRDAAAAQRKAEAEEKAKEIAAKKEKHLVKKS
ncbi:uncharacterized protein L203_100677 [Cryptococcus depauperatus CBS 7841]|uniref:Casein kinase substrate phosphoprotein PP28 domain-containing protein n=1 Tax=Cryptococcus depauperatus CBS 7841 TaxID=1295531 RepID=A0A1E3IXP1_9TREE|nr:hypothetical protein L203_00464 [Cryptococcus depauperatus CBS 7841]ODO02648.1 hypothetical protein L204_01387 [Cryptococcus depauperatus CBS 7855]